MELLFDIYDYIPALESIVVRLTGDLTSGSHLVLSYDRLKWKKLYPLHLPHFSRFPPEASASGVAHRQC